MAVHSLTPTRKNAVLGAIQTAGLDPLQFRWGAIPSQETMVGAGRPPEFVEMLTHGPTGYSFVFDLNLNNRGSLWAIYNPGPDGVERREHAGSWENVFGYVQQWVRSVSDEYHAPDLWAELGRERAQLSAAPAEIENTPFAPQEQAEIARQLHELKQYVRQTFELTEVQHQAIEARLDYFTEAASRLGRIDWRNAFAGAFITLVLSAVLPPEPIQHILRFVLRNVGFMFGGHFPELHELPPGAV